MGRPCRKRWLLIFWVSVASFGPACGDSGDPGQPDAATQHDAVAPPDTGAPDGAPPPRQWSAPENISQSATYSDLRINWGHSIALGAGGTVHTTWREVVDPQASPLLTKIAYRQRTPDPGGWESTQDLSPETPGLGHPKLAVAGSHVYVVWHRHDPATLGNDQVLLARSDTDGVTGSFTPPSILVDDAPVLVSPAGELSTSPSIAAVGDHVFVAWSDDRVVGLCGTNVPEVYLLRSSDGGGAWSSPLQVSTADCRSSWTPAVAVSGAHVHVAWTDDRHNTDDCALGSASCHEEEYYRRLSEYGATLDGAEVRLTNDDPGPPVESWAGSLATAGAALHYAWMDLSGGNGWEIHYARSTDAGVTWSLPGQVLTQHSPGCDSVRPTIASDGDAVHLVWFELCPDPGGDRATVYHRGSADGGHTWSDRSDVTSGNAQFAIQPSVAVAGDAVHVIWNDQAEIWYATS